jgi:hypothetical protein
MTKEVPKFGVQEVIQFVGVNKLTIEDQESINKLSTEYYEKIKRSVKNITSLSIHVKCHQEDGTRRKYSLHIRLICPSKTMESNKHHDFELNRAAHKAFQALLKEIQHNFHCDTTRPD